MNNTTNKKGLFIAQAEVSTLELKLIELAELTSARNTLVEYDLDYIQVNEAIMQLSGQNHEYRYVWINECQARIDHLRSKFNLSF